LLVHIGDPSSNQATTLASQTIHTIQELSGQTLSEGQLTNTGTAATLVACFLISLASCRFIETPFRETRSRINRHPLFVGAAGVSLFCLLTGAFIYVSGGMPGRYNPSTLARINENIKRRSDVADWHCSNFRKPIHEMSDIDFCETHGASNILFWEDSHILQLFPLLTKFKDAMEFGNNGLVFAIAAGCPMSEHMNRSEKGYYCDVFTRYAASRAMKNDISTVFIGFSTWWSLSQSDRSLCESFDTKCIHELSTDSASSIIVKELLDRAKVLKAAGKRVIITLPFPIWDKSIPDLMIRNAILRIDELPVELTSSKLLRAQIETIATMSGAEIFDPQISLCNNSYCLYQIDGVAIYSDSDHIATSQLFIFERDLRRVLFAPQTSQ
jgi:hypothetical protein